MPFLDRRAYDRLRKGRHRETPRARASRAARDRHRKDREADRKIVGVDGEGMDLPDGRHVYTYLAAVDETGRLVAEARNPSGLSFDECAAMLLEIPRRSLIFGFMFSYDVTKIVEGLAPADVYYLMRPQCRVRKVCRACKARTSRLASACPECGSEALQRVTVPLVTRGKKLDFFNGSFSVAEARKSSTRKKRGIKVWDCFRFFGCAFVQALKDWKVGTDAQIARLTAMKNKRGAFDKESPADVEAYCREECHLLAQMMRKLIDAHERAEIPLKRFEGAGSTASALLRKHEVENFRGPRAAVLPLGLQRAIAAAFFGGRFENSAIGLVRRRVWSYDIASAYPYALSDLPCLACGTWERVTGKPYRVRADLRLVRFRVRKVSDAERRKIAWGPLPFRSDAGSITYGTNFSGWAWSAEYEAARRFSPELVEHGGEEWIYRTPCEHKPFAFLPPVYVKRIAWGKDGAGKVLKLGPNATYGKCAQTAGDDPPFQQFAWAGPTTATCRGMLLDAIGASSDRWSVISLATDGLYGTERLSLADPRDTRTAGHLDPESGEEKPALGSWEEKEIPEGAFFAKPGLYFRLNAELKEIRARGVGRREVKAAKARLIRGFLKWDRQDSKYGIELTSRRFYGAKTSIAARSSCSSCGISWPGIPEAMCAGCGRVGDKFQTQYMKRDDGRDAIGTWGERPILVGFDPHPKRERALRQGGEHVRMHLRDLGGAESTPYEKGLLSPEARGAQIGKEISEEQPDWFDGMDLDREEAVR